MHWGIMAVLSGLGLATRNVVFKIASSKIGVALGAAVLSVSMALVTIGYLLYHRYTENVPLVPSEISIKAVGLAAIAGAGVAFANIFLAFSYKAGGPASLVAVVQNAFAFSLTILIGALIMGEVIRPLQALGILAAIAGIVMIVKG